MQTFPKKNLTDWENLVKKQLKTEEIYPILQKEIIENIDVKPYYDSSKFNFSLEKNTENTHLVAKFHSDLVNEHFAFLVEKPIESEDIKTLFTENENILNQKNIHLVYSLIDPFQDLETKNFSKNNIQVKANILKQLSYKTPHSVCIDVALHQNAGASMIQQLAMALAKTKEIIELTNKKSLQNLVFRFAVGHKYFLEIAKIRAFKILFHNLCQEYGVSQIPFIFIESSERYFSKNDEENNLIRSTLAITAAMIGGADAVYSTNYKISQESDLSNEISYKQQIILAYESIINVFPDAASGSYYIEEITQQLAEKSWSMFLEIEKSGGYLTLLNIGEIQEKIYQQAILEQDQIDSGKQKFIGINQYPKLDIIKNNDEIYSSKKLKKIALSAKYENK